MCILPGAGSKGGILRASLNGGRAEQDEAFERVTRCPKNHTRR
jgi:hypothetical protein